ncbi:MAG: lipid-A-disaccharide synthase [Planctomycetaceae bacterium]|nr:lipid-A-disaccharide synthase [Planctomycetaceae bacterium]
MKIFFSAGEPSGDQHAAHLMSELRSRHGDIQFEGFGGPKMQADGCQLLFELTQMAVMGFLRVVPLLAKFRRLVIQAEQHFDQSAPDAVVLVDFPGFNWWIAKAAKKRGIPVYYYMPPQLWGWAPWRIRRVRKWVDHVFCALPFEYDWYSERGVKASWVGHPFFDEVASHEMDQPLVDAIRSAAAGHTVAVLPGSRDHEVERNFPVMLEAIARAAARNPGTQWVVGNYKSEHETRCKQLAASAGVDVPLQYHVGRTSEVIEAADCCYMVSGSISLELLARHTPGMVLYRVPKIGHIASKVLMTCDYITLTNLVAGRDIMPEFISSGDPADDIQGMADQLDEWLGSPESLQRVTAEMADVASTTVSTGATAQTADILLHDLLPDTAAARAA